MINLRYHIVSITAVFLALGIGTALGGTFLDKYTVDVLERNISSAEERIRNTDADNSRLRGQLAAAEERDQALIQVGSADLLAGELTDVPVLIVASEGVNADIVANLRLTLNRAGADLRGTLELRDRLDLRDDVDDSIAELVEQDPSDPDAVRAAVHSGLRDALHAAGQPAVVDEPEPSDDTTTTTPGTTAPGDATTVPEGANTTTVPESDATTTTQVDGATPPDADDENTDEDRLDGTQPELVSALIEADFLRLTPGPGREDDPILETEGYRYVFVGDPELGPVPSRVMLALLPTPARRAVPAVVVSASVPETDDELTPSIVAQVRSNNERAAIYSTVDDAESFTGLAATVLVLRDLETAETGHYGQGAGASAVLPGTT